MKSEPQHAAPALPRIRRPLVWACGTGLAFAAALVAVQSTLRPEPHRGAHDRRQAERARELERLGREVGSHLHELAQVPAVDSPSELESWKAEIGRKLRPRVAELNRRILAAPFEGATYQALLQAADRLGAAAANPGDSRTLDAARSAYAHAQSVLREDAASVRQH